MRQQLPYTASLPSYSRSRTRSESSIHNLDDAPPPPASAASLFSGGSVRHLGGHGANSQPNQPPQPPRPPPSPPMLREIFHDAATSPSSRSFDDLPPRSPGSARGGSSSMSTSKPSSPRRSGTGRLGLRSAASKTIGNVRGRFNTWDGAPAVPDIGVSAGAPGSSTGVPASPLGSFGDATGPSEDQHRQQNYQQQQMQQIQSSSASSFGTGADSARDAAIAAAWLSGSVSSSGGGGGGGAIFGPTSGKLPSYRRSGEGDPFASSLTEDDTLLGPYDADDGLGDENSSGRWTPSLVVPHLPSTIDEEKEEILSSDEESEWLGGIKPTGSGDEFIADNNPAIADAEETDGDDDMVDPSKPQRSIVRWMSESSELSISVADEDEDYYINEEDGVDDLDETSDGDESSWRRRAAAGGGRSRSLQRLPSNRNIGAGAAKHLHSPSAASMPALPPAQPVRLCGVTLPLFLTTCPPRIEKPSWNRVSSYIVRHAPCFWCGARLETSATDRAVLGRLNVLCAIFALVQGGSGIFLFVVQNLGGGSPEEEQLERQSLTPNLWSLNGMVFFLGLVGIILFITMILTLRVIREVNLLGAVRYMWALYWLLPIEILLVVSLFDYHRVTDVWIRHWWLTPSFDWFRGIFCLEGTADTKCAVPSDGGAEYDSEEEWCVDNYNATDCLQIKTDAQMEMSTVSYTFLTANAIWGLLLVALLCLALTMLEGIITSPIVQSSKQANIPAWLTLPFLGCLAGGATLLFSPSSAASNESEVFWIGVAYMASGGSFLVAALLGWFISAYSVLNSRDKQHKQIAVSLFIATMVLTIFILVVIFAASLVFSVDLVDYGISDEERGMIACYVDTANSCTNCYPTDPFWDPDAPQCPEWTMDDILKVLQTQLKQSATLAAIFLIYAFSALRFGFVLRSHVSRYQIEYV